MLLRTLFLTFIVTASLNAQDLNEGKHYFIGDGVSMYMDVRTDGRSVYEFTISRIDDMVRLYGSGNWVSCPSNSKASKCDYYTLTAPSNSSDYYRLVKNSDSSFLLYVHPEAGDEEFLYSFQLQANQAAVQAKIRMQQNLTEEVYVFPDESASFPGGMDSLMNFIKTNITYPKEAEEADIQGIVYLRFVVEMDGQLTQLEVLKSPHILLSKEALRVMGLSPKWIPATMQGKAVRSYFTIPIRFKLD